MPLVGPTDGRASRAIKLGVSTVYVMLPLGVLAYRTYNGQSVDSLILLIIVMLMFASAYVIYGEKIVDKAAEQAQEVTNDGGGGE